MVLAELGLAQAGEDARFEQFAFTQEQLFFGSIAVRTPPRPDSWRFEVISSSKSKVRYWEDMSGATLTVAMESMSISAIILA